MSAHRTKTISNPLRLLILTPSEQPSPRLPNANPAVLLPPLLESLTSSAPPPDLPTFSGYTSHPPLKLRTKYYDADVPIWVDEIPPPPPATSPSLDVGHSDEPESEPGELAAATPTLPVWKHSMLSASAHEVLRAIGGLLLVLPLPADLLARPSPSAPSATYPGLMTKDADAYVTDLLAAVSEIRDEIKSVRGGGECAACVVLQEMPTASSYASSPPPSSSSSAAAAMAATLDEFETLLLNQAILGWDVVAWDGNVVSKTSSSGSTVEEKDDDDESERRNAYGEKMGLPRVREILEAVEWGGPSHGEDDDNDDYDDPSLSFLPAARHLEDSDGGDAGSDYDDFLKPDEQELQREMMGLSMAIREQSQRSGEGDEGEGEAEDADENEEEEEASKVDSLPGLMERVMAVREKGAGLQGKEKERFTRRAVEEIMKDW